jgi:N-acetylmuramoyl-L-alanine amidase
MKNILYVVLLFLIFGPTAPLYSQVSGLSGWTIFLDPGHSQKENMGIYNYSEAEKVLRVALALREMLENRTLIDAVYMSRTNDTKSVSLTQRTDLANKVAAAFYYSIHSDAGTPTANSTLFLHGGWRSDGQTIEKTPLGGKKMGDIMNIDLPHSMRLPTRGNYADRTFYQGFPDNHTNKWPYLHVNRESNMASVLSEAGFHTNPRQNQRNMNAEWKRLEAQSAFWSILEYHNIERPDVGIATGYITNTETGTPLNGAEVTIGNQTYTTDTYESLFHKYSSDPKQLSNGFYYLEGLTPGETYLMVVSAPDYYPDSTEIVIVNKDFTFADMKLVSSVPPSIVSTLPVSGDTNLVIGINTIEFQFSRNMNRESVENAIEIDPPASLSFNWLSDSRLRIPPDSLEYETHYTLTINETAEDKYGHLLDGDGDGESGGIFSLSFKTAAPDTIPPQIVGMYPAEDQTGVELRPILNFELDEQVASSSITTQTIELIAPDQTLISGTRRHYVIDQKSIISFFPSANLFPETQYTVRINPGLRDRFNNTTEEPIEYTFTTDSLEFADVTIIDNFQSGVTNWWEPQQSGSTTGIITEETSRNSTLMMVNLLSGSSSAMIVTYGWDTSPIVTTHLIRVYLNPGTAPQLVRFTKDYIMQAYVFGDGSGNRMRFVVRDANNQLEASGWYTVDWIGWRLVSWDMTNDPVFGWVNGNGALDGNLFVDSFQLTWTQGMPTTGFIVFDDFRVVRKSVVSMDDEIADLIPNQYRLEQNYPNPFNPMTTIQFGLPKSGYVTLKVYNILGEEVATLIDGDLTAGLHTIDWIAGTVASGIYFYRLQAEAYTETKKMLYLK